MNLTAAGRIVGRKATTVARQLVHERSTIGMTSTGIRVPTYRQYASVDDSSTYDRIKVLTAIGEVRWEDIVAQYVERATCTCTLLVRMFRVQALTLFGYILALSLTCK